MNSQTVCSHSLISLENQAENPKYKQKSLSKFLLVSKIYFKETVRCEKELQELA